MKTKFTKIVATVSDRRCDVDFIKQLAENGLNVVRMNSAHIQREGFQRIVNNVRAVSDRIGILMDTKGPEIRTTTNVDDENLSFSAGDKVCVTGAPDELSDKQNIHLSYPDIANDVKAGMHLLIDDGELDFLIDCIDGKTLRCTAMNDGELGSRKSVNIPGASIKLPSLTQRDIQNIGYAIEMGVDFIAHSFVRSRQDVLDIQKILDANNSPIKIISKIENQEGIDNIDEILEVSYGIMIARGDLGIEVPIEKIPGIQRNIIRKCRRARKPVIVATQMLHSMISNPRPTRAEVTDIANAVFSRTDALMLSGETASGKYPVEAVRTMAHIAEQAEKEQEYSRDIDLGSSDDDPVREFLAQAAFRASMELGLRGILIDSATGRMARNLAAFRGPTPIMAICYKEQLVRTLNLSYGVYTHYDPEHHNKSDLFRLTAENMLRMGYAKEDDKLAYLTGLYDGNSFSTLLEINSVREEITRKR